MDKILASYVEDFAEKQGFGGLPPAEQFHHFVNYCLVSRATSESFDIEDLSTEGDGDIGVDGVAVLVNGHIVSSPEDVDYFRDRVGRVDVEFIFVQSKSGAHFSAAQIGTFLFGVKEFFSEASKAEANAGISAFRDLKDYIYKLSIDMNKPPVCSLYYAAAGEWYDDANLRARVDSGRAELEATHLFSAVIFTPVDANRLKALYRTLRNKVECEVLFDKHTILPQIAGVTEAYLGILPCHEYLRLITDEDGDIRRGLFYDNVRDFQGENPVNREIAATFDDPNSSGHFVLLNNGVTIVARSINKVGAKFRVTDYQVVNGCQTSHVLHRNRDRIGPAVFLPIKLVVTDDPEVTNRVIRATNRQTEVKVEAFESLTPFHRTLEEFYSSFGKDCDRGKRLYYERRSKQYLSLPVPERATVSLAMQCKAFLAMFLDEPHSTPRYYGEILTAKRGRMFQEDHRPYPYYAAAYCLVRIEDLFRQRELPLWCRKFRYHMMMLVRMTAGGKKMPPMSSKGMDKYCEDLCAVLWDDTKLLEHAKQAVASIDKALSTFIGDKTLAKRLRSFTTHLVPSVADRPRGEVKYYNLDRGFGFITSKDHDKDIFVHFTAIKATIHRCLQVGQHVEFDVVQTDRGLQAENVTVIGSERQAAQVS
jgi:cold shock CspA family protein